MAKIGGRRCYRCSYKIKGGDHSFGRFGPQCTWPPRAQEDEDASQPEDPNSAVLQKLLKKVEQLEQAYSSSGSKGKKPKSAKKVTIDEEESDEDSSINIDKMTPAQLKVYAKNLTKEKQGSDKTENPDSFLAGKKNQKANHNSISNLFEEADQAEDMIGEQSSLQRAAEALKSRNTDKKDEGSSRIENASVISDLRSDPWLRDQVDQFMRDIGDKAASFQNPSSLHNTFDPRDTWRRDPRDPWKYRREDCRQDSHPSNKIHTDFNQERAARDSNLLSSYRGNSYRGQKELDEYLVRNTLSANTVAYAGVALQKSKELTHNNCNIAQFGVGAFFYLKNALIDKTIKSKAEIFSILSHYEHIFTCTANGTFGTTDLTNRAFRVALQYDQKVSSAVDSGVTSWSRLGEGLHAEYMLQAKDIIEAKERKNNADRYNSERNQADRPWRMNKGGNPNEKNITICGDYNNKENEPGKCSWAVEYNKTCRYQHSCRSCWNSKKQLNDHRELECKSKSGQGQPFLDNGQ